MWRHLLFEIRSFPGSFELIEWTEGTQIFLLGSPVPRRRKIPKFWIFMGTGVTIRIFEVPLSTLSAQKIPEMKRSR